MNEELNNIKSLEEEITFGDIANKYFDIYYYCSEKDGEEINFPSDIEDEFGAEAMYEFLDKTVVTLEALCGEPMRTAFAAFAVPHDDINPESLSVEFREKKYSYRKRTVFINTDISEIKA